MMPVAGVGVGGVVTVICEFVLGRGQDDVPGSVGVRMARRSPDWLSTRPAHASPRSSRYRSRSTSCEWRPDQCGCSSSKST